MPTYDVDLVNSKMLDRLERDFNSDQTLSTERIAYLLELVDDLNESLIGEGNEADALRAEVKSLESAADDADRDLDKLFDVLIAEFGGERLAQCVELMRLPVSEIYLGSWS